MQIKWTKDRLAREENRFSYLLRQGSSHTNGTQEVVRFGDLNTIIIGNAEGQRGTSGRTCEFLKDKWAFRRINRRYNGFGTMFGWVFLLLEEIVAAL